MLLLPSLLPPTACARKAGAAPNGAGRSVFRLQARSSAAGITQQTTDSYQPPQPLTDVSSGMCGQRSWTADAFPSWPGLTRPSPEASARSAARRIVPVSGDGRDTPYRVHISRQRRPCHAAGLLACCGWNGVGDQAMITTLGRFGDSRLEKGGPSCCIACWRWARLACGCARWAARGRARCGCTGSCTTRG